MSSIRKTAFLSLFAVAILLLQNSAEASIGGTVCRKRSDLIMEIYRPSIQDVAVELDLCTGDMSRGIDASLPNIRGDLTQNCVDPAFWGAADSLIRETELLFADSIGLAEQSVLLWFVGDDKSISDSQHIVPAEAICNTAFTQAGPLDNNVRITAPAWAANY
jgi:hypothetical protein